MFFLHYKYKSKKMFIYFYSFKFTCSFSHVDMLLIFLFIQRIFILIFSIACLNAPSAMPRLLFWVRMNFSTSDSSYFVLNDFRTLSIRRLNVNEMPLNLKFRLNIKILIEKINFKDYFFFFPIYRLNNSSQFSTT